MTPTASAVILRGSGSLLIIINPPSSNIFWRTVSAMPLISNGWRRNLPVFCRSRHGFQAQPNSRIPRIVRKRVWETGSNLTYYTCPMGRVAAVDGFYETAQT